MSSELYARIACNILVSNDDDHLRNHAFVWVPEGKGWRLSPLYDVVPRARVAAERYLHMSVRPQGRLATLDKLLEAHGSFGLLKKGAACHYRPRRRSHARIARSLRGTRRAGAGVREDGFCLSSAQADRVGRRRKGHVTQAHRIAVRGSLLLTAATCGRMRTCAKNVTH